MDRTATCALAGALGLLLLALPPAMAGPIPSEGEIDATVIDTTAQAGQAAHDAADDVVAPALDQVNRIVATQMGYVARDVAAVDNQVIQDQQDAQQALGQAQDAAVGAVETAIPVAQAPVDQALGMVGPDGQAVQGFEQRTSDRVEQLTQQTLSPAGPSLGSGLSETPTVSYGVLVDLTNGIVSAFVNPSADPGSLTDAATQAVGDAGNAASAMRGYAVGAVGAAQPILGDEVADALATTSSLLPSM
jgi:hypothetical protein